MLYQLRPSVGLYLQAPAQAESVALARDAVRGMTPIPGLPLADLLTVTSELMSNAVRHAGLATDDKVILDLTRVENSMRITVTDHGPSFDPADTAASTPEGPFGLRLVDRLSRAWGVIQHEGAVWADIALQRADHPYSYLTRPHD